MVTIKKISKEAYEILKFWKAIYGSYSEGIIQKGKEDMDYINYSKTGSVEAKE